MNKTYRTVWNATTGTWTAAAETARMRTKSKTNTAMRSSVTAAVAVMAGVGGVAMSADANAQAANGGGSLSLCAPSGSGYYGTTFGGGNTVGTRTTAACGTAISNFRLSEGHVRSFQLYNNSNVNGGGVGQASAATEAGISGTVDGHLFLLGGSGVHLRGPVDVDSNFNMTNHRINNLAAGTAGTDAVNVNQLNAAIAAAGTANPYVVTNTGTYAAATAARAGGSATAIGANANAGGTSAVALGGNTVATGQNAVALGTLANATGAETVAVGVSARATGNNSTAMGRGAAAVSTNATSVGYSAYAGADGATALGTTASAVGANAIAVGRGASTSGTYGSAIGYSANATTNAVAIGVLANATSASSVALGERASATGSTATALGRGALASGTNAVALGANSVGDRNNAVSVGSTSLQRQITNVAAGTQNTDAVNLGQMNAAIAAGSNPYVAVRGSTAARASGTQSIAIGDGAIANATNTNGGQTNIAVGAKAYTSGGFGQLAIGEGASATNANAGGAIAIGRGAMTTQRGVALGDGASVTAQYGVALGDTSVADRANSVSVGSASLQRQITNVAAGTQNTDAVNLGQMNTALSTKVDNTYVKINGGGNAATATGSQATAIGANASATSASATAIGDNTLAGGFATAVGHLASATGGTSVAVGGGATASGSMASAFGRNTVASGARSAAIGNMAVASGDDANAFGNSSTASGARSATLGYNAKATAADSVAIGSNSDTGTRTFAVSVGSATQQRQIVNVAAGTQATDAVNVGQLSGVTKALGGGAAVDGSGNVKQPTYKVAGTDYHNVGDALDALAANGSSDPNAVTYDGATKDKVTLKGAGGTTLSNVKAGVANMDAVNVGQLKGSGLIGDDGKSIAAVTYDRNADGTPNMGSVTLGGAGATTPVALKNVADAKDNHDALNLGQLKDAGLVGDDGKGNLTSMAVTYDGAARDKVTLGGADGTTLSNVKAGVADMDAVNVSQLKGSGLIGDDGKSIAAVTYDRNADGTPNYGTVTLGNGAGPTQIKNVATGVDDLDAVNVKQLNTGLSDLRDEMSGGNLRFVKVNADPVTGTPAVASGALAVAIGSDARATSANSLALGSGARVTGDGSVAIGYNSVANQSNVVSVGDVGSERKIVNVADGDVAFQSTDAVNGGQLYAALNDLSTSVSSKTQQAIDNFSSEIDKKTKAAIDEVGSRSMQPMDVSDPLVAIEGLKGNNVASLNGADPATATAAAIGSSTAASGANAVAVGLQSGAGSNNSVAIGSFAQTGAGQDYSVAVGSNVQTNGTQAVALGANAQANGNYALAVGNNGAQAIGDGSVAVGNAANVRAGSTNAIAIGTGANVARSVEGAMALGANATAGAANSVALGANSFSNRANALSVGRAGAERQIVNVAAGTQATDAVNVSQLKGVTDALGGGAAVGADGTVTSPTYSLADPTDATKSKSYNNVGDALSNLDGRTTTNTQNITVINKQLADSGLVDPATGQSITAVTYDRNADGTPNLGSVTLGGAGATTPVALKNVADAKDDHDALNLGQLKDAGLVGDDGKGNLTSMAVTYDGAARDKVTLGGADGTTLANVKAGVADMDAVNVSQLKGSGLIGDDGKANAAVTYDRNADGTPNYGTVTLGHGAGPTQLKNVADATDDGDALNLGQLKDAGLVGDDGKGNLTSMAVTYDGTARDKVTLGGADGTTLANVKAGVADMDAVNVSQLKGSGLIGDDGKANAAVTYDRNADGTPNYGTVTLGHGAGPTQLKNVADATDDGDALNLGQLKDAGLVGDDGKGNLTSMAVTYDGAAKDSITLGGVGATTPVAIHNVKDGELSATSKDAVNGSQLFATNTRVGDLEDSLSKGGVIDPVTGESLAVVYDGTAKDTVTLKGADGTTLANVKAGVADMDAVNVSQLKGSGLIGDDGKSVAAVTYDRLADGTPNYGSVTLGHGAGPTQIKNVADATDDHDAVNFNQLKQYVADNDSGNPLAVGYDDNTKAQVTLKGADGTTLTNVKAGAVTATSTDAINGAQLHGTAQSVADSLGGGSTVGADGKVTNPSYALADPADASKSKSYNNVGDALSNLDGRTTTNTENITVINKQLADSGLVDPATGQSITAVTYDRNADGTPNMGSVTLGGAGATAPVALKNVADGVDRHDALNVGQLQDAGLVAPVDPANPGAGLTSLAVAYDDVAKDTVTLKGADGTTLSNVKAGVADMDAVNVSQLKGSGLIGDDGKANAAVTYDRNADGTPNYGSVTLGHGTGPTQIKNVANATDDGDALNLGQLKSAGVVGDDGKGNLTSMAVTYDGAAKDTVTLGGAGATTPVALKNVADGTDRHDAINLGQLQDAGLVAPIDPSNPGKGLTSLAVAYDDASQNTVTLKGADGTTLTNVKAGAVTATSTDAVNGAQLHGTAQSVADSLGGGSTVGADGKVTNPSYSLADPADASKSKSYNNVGDALSNLDGRTTTNTENITVINKQLADSGLVDPVSGQSIAAVTYDRNADGTANRGSVTLGGAGATGPVALKNVADGVDKHDAVNVGQLQSAGVLTPIDPTNPGAGLTSLAVTYDKQANGSANFDQITLKGANGTTLSNVKAGAVNATSMDAVNGSQLYGASKSVADALGGGSTVDANGNVTNPTYTVNDKKYNNVGDAIENISSSLVHGSIGLVQQDADTREITVAKDTDGTSVNFAGTAGDRVLTGVGAGAVSATSRDAINGSQLHGTAQSVADTIGGGTTVDADGKLVDTSIEVNGSKYKTVAEAVQAAAQYGATDSLAVRYDLNKDGTPNYGSVTLGGSGAAPVRLGNVADGVNKNDAVNYGQLSALNDKIGGLDDRVGELERNPGTGNPPGNGGSGNDYFAGTDVGTGSTTKANAGSGTGNTAAGSGSTIGTGANNATVVGSNANVSTSNGTAIGSGSKSSAEGATAIGSSANASGEKSTAIGEGAKASGKNSVALGAGSVASSDNTVSVGTPDQQRTISNLADGVNASDAATKGQMDRAIGGVQGQVNDLSRNAYSGIAAATALTMIPGVDPGKTVSFGIGGATYKGYQAVAFGGEARITQNLKMKAGVGMSSGGNTVGVGASYQW
ncbi:YadA-like family protein [Burkholderia cepacia]|uniref:YadA-like family protein n=3 Tax=Burkholderia cepacia TaxID=292 RepID=UPI0007566D12|nr:YadA-like family protein [Burkholderia cepacia]KVX56618.1 hypothetical protein WL06_11195 [Burkholderia cepacia]KWD63733.1 hypothetical protein WL68_18140 [Burkholderia cepacia]